MSHAAAPLRTIQIALPGDLADHSDTMITERLRLLWLIDQVRQVRISAGRAAELAGVPLLVMYDLLAEHGVPLLRMTDEELDEEIRTLERLEGQPAR
jgi:predicted HTH domain antitoxin